MHVAMTVGASRVQVLADAELARLEPLATAPSDGSRALDGDQTTGGGFAAAAVEAQADGG